MNNSLTFFIFSMLFIFPGVVSLIYNGEKAALCPSSNTKNKEHHIQSVFNTLKSLLILTVLMVFQAIFS
jgi:hypothetical protein